MTYLYGHAKVENFDTWKSIFDKREEVRNSAGLKLLQVYHSLHDRNEVHWLFEVDNVDNAREMMESADLKQAQAEGGIIGKPHFHFLKSI
jgi:hypothetical protein